MNRIDQFTARAMIDQMANALNMPDLQGARWHSRIAIIDYATAYRCNHSPEQTSHLLESAWLHFEKAIEAGAYRERLDAHFYRIRQRFSSKKVVPE